MVAQQPGFLSVLLGWLDGVPAFQYGVVRHKISLQCGGGRRRGDKGGTESHGNSILSYDSADSAVAILAT